MSVCEDCKFFEPIIEAEGHTFEGFCCRYPPKLFLFTPTEAVSKFPTTGVEDWCGEYIETERET